MSTTSVALPKPRPISPIRALLWEEWRQTRKSLLVGTAVGALCVLVALALAELSKEKDPNKYSSVYLPVFLLFFWQTAVLLFSGYGRNDLTLQFPRRLFALPVDSASLALTRLMYGTAVVAITFGILGWSLSRHNEVFGPPYSFAVHAVETFVFWESMAWLLGRRPLLTFVVGWLLWIVCILLLNKLTPPKMVPVSTMTVLGLTVWCAVFSVVALYAVQSQRHGGRTKRIRRSSRAVTVDEPKVPSVSSADALFAFEWYRRGRWVLLFMVGSFVAATAVSMMIGTTAFIPCPSSMEPIIAGLLGASLFQVFVSERDRVSGFHTYVSIRPISTRDLGMARIRALAIAYGVSSACLAVLMVVTTPAIIRLQGPFHYPNPWGIREQWQDLGGQLASASCSPIDMIKDHVSERDRLSAKNVPVDLPLRTGDFSSEVHQRIKNVNRINLLQGLPPVESPLKGARVATGVIALLLFGWLLLTNPVPTLVAGLLSASLVGSVHVVAADPSHLDPVSTLALLLLGLAVFGRAVVHFRRARRLGFLPDRSMWLLLGAWVLLTWLGLLMFSLAGTTPRAGIGLRVPFLAEFLVAAAATLPLWPFASIPLSIHRQRHQ
jgi:hypothetical protein